MGAGKLKQDTLGTVARIEYSEEGFLIYCVRLETGRVTWLAG